MHLTTPRKIFTAGGAILDGTVEGVLLGLVTDDNGNQILVRVDIVLVPGIGRDLFSVTTVTKKDIVTIFHYENSRLEGFSVTEPLRSESGDLYSFVLDLSADRYGGWVISMHRVWTFYASEMALVSRSGGLSRIAPFAPWGKLNSLLTPRQRTTGSTGLSSCATGT